MPDHLATLQVRILKPGVIVNRAETFEASIRESAYAGPLFRLILLGGIAACLLSARRAARLDPVLALRRE